MNIREIINENQPNDAYNSQRTQDAYKNRKKIQKNYTNEMLKDSLQDLNSEKMNQISSKIVSMVSVLKSFKLKDELDLGSLSCSAQDNFNNFSQYLLKIIYLFYQMKEKTDHFKNFPLFLIKNSFPRFIQLFKFYLEESILTQTEDASLSREELNIKIIEENAIRSQEILTNLFKKTKWPQESLRTIKQLLSLLKTNSSLEPITSFYFIYVSYELIINFIKQNLLLSDIFGKNAKPSICLLSIQSMFFDLVKWLNLSNQHVRDISCLQSKSFFNFVF
jgi:hypothetical protein